MSKLRCKCGHTIVDQANNLPYKGQILPDQNIDGFDGVFDKIDTLIESITNGKRIDWINENFDGSVYPTDLKNSSMIYDLICSKFYELNRTIYQCENCQRIWIQIGETEVFAPFAPESQDCKDILKIV